MRLVAIVAVLALVGCSDEPAPIYYAPHCEPNNQPRSQWILDCSAAANPHADEEGEDLVKQCEQTSERLFCPLVECRWSGGECVPVRPRAPVMMGVE